MGNSRKKRTVGPAVLCHAVDLMAYPERTPGSLGINDAGDPSRLSLLGDTPGPTGVNDCGAPGKYLLPGLNTFHDWALETKFHLPSEQQVAGLYPAGKKEDVLAQAATFLTEAERVEEHPYIPLNKDGTVMGASGVTIGLGYDLGQHTEAKIRQDWAELDTRSQPPGISLKGRSFGLPELKVDESLIAGLPPTKAPLPKLTLDSILTDPSPVDLLAKAAGLQKARAQKYLPEVKGLTVFKDLALNVFRKTMLPEYYDQAAKFFPGLTELPTGVQVAIVSLVFNTGTVHRKEGKVTTQHTEPVMSPSPSPSMSLGLNLNFGGKANPPSPRQASKLSFGLEPLRLGTTAAAKKTEPEPEATTVTSEEEDFFGNDWEKRQLKEAVRTKDVVWIHWYFESSRRIWAKEPGMVKRRNDEASLIFPYVAADLQREAFLRRYHNL
jgi:hypothetical protein